MCFHEINDRKNIALEFGDGELSYFSLWEVRTSDGRVRFLYARSAREVMDYLSGIKLLGSKIQSIERAVGSEFNSFTPEEQEQWGGK